MLFLYYVWIIKLFLILLIYCKKNMIYKINNDDSLMVLDSV